MIHLFPCYLLLCSDLSPRALGPSALQSLNPKSPRAVHQVFSGMSTPIMSSGSSTPPGGGYGCSPLLPNQVSGAFSQYPSEGYGNNSSRTQSGRYASPSPRNGGVVYPEPRKDFYWNTPPQQRTPEGSPMRSRNHSNVDNNILDFALGRMTLEDDIPTQYHGNGIFGEHLISQHLHPRQPGSSHQSPPLLSRTNSHEFGRQW